MTPRLVRFILVCSVLSGCSSAVHVYRSQPTATNSGVEEIKGIPFYVKKGMCKQETVWVEPQYTLSNKILDGIQDKVLDHEGYLAASNPDNIHKGSFWLWVSNMRNPLRVREEGGSDAVDKNQVDIAWQVQHGNWALVSNTGTVQAVVDYSQVYYLNTAKPLAGTTQLSYKLAADGTLTEGSAQVNDQTLATVASVISSLTSDAVSFAPLLADRSGAPPPEDRYPVKTRLYKHTHTLYVPLDANGGCGIQVGGVLGGSFTITEETDASAKPKSGTDNNIGFSGSVTLPKALLPAPASSTPTNPTPASPSTGNMAAMPQEHKKPQ